MEPAAAALHLGQLSPDAVIVAAFISCGGEGLRAILGADLVHAAVSLVPSVAILCVMPIPKFFIIGPAAAGRFQGVLVFLGVATDPEPGAAKLNYQAVHRFRSGLQP